ncbi:MAG: PAS domain S-box protein [Chloroflexi bacterium]|nr:PAS domain S-box protein [Chloroflexota bacterium]
MRTLGGLRDVLAKPGLWLIVAVLALISAPHYAEALQHPSFLTELMASLNLQRHAFERILYLVPIIWAGFLFERRGALITSFAAFALMLPRALLISPFPTDSIFETFAVFIFGNVVALSFESLRKERERRIQLAALNQTSSVISQSLDLEHVLNSSAESVIDVMKVDAALAFLVDHETEELCLAAHKGVSEDFVRGVGCIKLGEGFNGRVAQTGEPMFIRDAAADPRLTRMAVKQEGLHSMLIVPLKSKGRVMGTLSVSMRSQRQFRKEEVDLLTAIGNQVGVAVENAGLYEQERVMTARLRASEERYRQLFENAHDAIWLHDLEGNIIAANKACVKLTGYVPEELNQVNAIDLLSESSAIGAAEQELMKGEGAGFVSEAKLIRKDGTEAFIQLSTSPVFSNGKATAFQHIARDVTEEKKMKENLRFYLGQVTRAQEEERKRIARELHDDTIQALVVLSRQLDELAPDGKGLPEDKQAVLDNLRQQTNNIMQDVRRLSQDLRPATLDRLGLIPALEWLACEIEKLSSIKVEVKVQGAERRLPAEVELVLFRIAQEALRNVWRHSQATHAQMVVEFLEARIKIAVTDDGKGFDLPEDSGDLVKGGRLGLAGMQERVQLLSGVLKIESAPGKGTTVRIEAPI